jgi:AhpD family alkylhydroperoxidase
MSSLDAAVRATGLEAPLLELVKIRASQINGCAFCLDVHVHDARAAGESQQRLDTLAGWHDAPFFTDRERAALDLTEAVTNVAQTHVPDEVWWRASEQFESAELAALVWAIAAINAWNRVSIAIRSIPRERK